MRAEDIIEKATGKKIDKEKLKLQADLYDATARASLLEHFAFLVYTDTQEVDTLTQWGFLKVLEENRISLEDIYSRLEEGVTDEK